VYIIGRPGTQNGNPDLYVDEIHKPEQIVTLLQHIEVEIASGTTSLQACKEDDVAVQTLSPDSE
jgi:hypothetical protein